MREGREPYFLQGPIGPQLNIDFSCHQRQRLQFCFAEEAHLLFSLAESVYGNLFQNERRQGKAI